MNEPKTKINDNDVLAFIDSNPSKQKRADGHVILEFMKELTDLEPRMWGPSIIGFGTYEYKYESGHGGRAALLAFSPRKTKLVLYVLSDFEGQEELLSRLGKHKTGKICLYINKLADVDMEVLKQIITADWEHNKHKLVN